MHPPLNHPFFASSLVSASNYQALQIPPHTPVLNEAQFEKRAKAYCEGYEKFPYQYVAQQYLGPMSPYRGLLVYHGLGFGKTCSAITFAEALLAQNLKEIWVITSGALEDNFRSQLYRPGAGVSQCMAQTYPSMGMGTRPIDARYKFMTYDRFGNLVKEKADAGLLKEWAKNRTIIIDEAHNLRNPTIKGSKGLEMFLKSAAIGSNNRLVLLTATPMFDRADEIAQMLYYLVLNDHRTDLGMTPKAIQEAKFYNSEWEMVFQQLCANYISYVKGRNPFTLAARLSPVHSGMRIWTPSTVPTIPYSFKSGAAGDGAAMEATDDHDGTWLRWVEDGVFPTELSERHADVMRRLAFVKETVKRKMMEAKKKKETDATPIHTNVLEATNIIYPGGTPKKPKYLVGSDGFQTVFKSLGPSGPFEYYGAPVLFPSATEGYLKTFAAKLYRVAELLQSSQGIVLIYSHFIWSGVMPMAMVLEHLGYTRYKEPKLLRWTEADDANVKNAGAGADALPKTPGRSYAIFCSDPTISGVETFQGMLDEINDPGNKTGERVKVILMSPVGSEGISFLNVREVHILDPWFHLNRLEQVIGRSIRTCSHKNLPLAERNVSVFLHASHDGTEHESYDLYTYRMAAEKKETMMKVERTIQTHALDCSLQKPLHYYPKSLFPFELRQQTSQGGKTVLRLGDPEDAEPVCMPAAQGAQGAPAAIPKARGWRREIYEPMKQISQERLRKQLADGKVWNTEELLRSIGLPIEIGWLGLEALANNPPTGQRLVRHRLKVALLPEAAGREKIRRMPLVAAVPKKERPMAEGCEDLVEMMLQNDMADSKNDTVRMVSFLLTLNVECWEPFAQRVIQENLQTPLTMALWKNGWLISAAEVGGTGTKWVGYILLDLIKKETDTPYRLIEDNGSQWRDATRAEKARIVEGRATLPETPEAPYGFYVLHRRAGQPTTFKLKFLLDATAKREKTGMVGTSIPSGVLRDWIGRLQGMFPKPPSILPNFTIKENQSNRTYLVSWVAYYLGMLGRLRIPPIYKKK
jgi:superfamily II DNA or RNA helicase